MEHIALRKLKELADKSADGSITLLVQKGKLRKVEVKTMVDVEEFKEAS